MDQIKQLVEDAGVTVPVLRPEVNLITFVSRRLIDAFLVVIYNRYKLQSCRFRGFPTG